MFKIVEARPVRSEEHTSELQSPCNLVCRLLLEKKKKKNKIEKLILRISSKMLLLSTRHMMCRCTTSCGLLVCSRMYPFWCFFFFFFFFNDTATTEIYTLSLHDALPIYADGRALILMFPPLTD